MNFRFCWSKWCLCLCFLPCTDMSRPKPCPISGSHDHAAVPHSPTGSAPAASVAAYKSTGVAPSSHTAQSHSPPPPRSSCPFAPGSDDQSEWSKVCTGPVSYHHRGIDAVSRAIRGHRGGRVRSVQSSRRRWGAWSRRTGPPSVAWRAGCRGSYKMSSPLTKWCIFLGAGSRSRRAGTTAAGSRESRLETLMHITCTHAQYSRPGFNYQPESDIRSFSNPTLCVWSLLYLTKNSMDKK